VATGLGLPLERLDPMVDEMVAFLVVASVSREAREELIEEAVRVFDYALLPAVRQGLDEAALHFIEYTGLDAIDMIDCIGGDALSETISWAVNTLAGIPVDRPKEVEAYAECAGIRGDLLSADDTLLASAVFYSFVAAINRVVQSLVA